MVRDYYGAYPSRDRIVVEQHLTDNFTFSSSADVGIDRATYFERCWPNSETIAAFEYPRLFEAKDEVFVTYEGDQVGSRGRPLAVDLCCGAGGLSGLEQAGFRVVLGVDHDPEALETHRARCPGLRDAVGRDPRLARGLAHAVLRHSQGHGGAGMVLMRNAAKRASRLRAWLALGYLDAPSLYDPHGPAGH